MSVSPTKELHGQAILICEKHHDQLSSDEYDALALIAVAYDAGAPIKQEQIDEAETIIARIMPK